MNEQKHTPTPWRARPDGKFHQVVIPTGKIGLPSETGECVFQPTPYYDAEQQQANAAFIVRACNAHESMFDVLGHIQQLAFDYGAGHLNSEAFAREIEEMFCMWSNKKGPTIGSDALAKARGDAA